GPTVVNAATTFSYSLVVTNIGPSTAAAATVTDTLPAGFTFVSASDGGTAAGGVVTWNLADMAVGTRTLTVTVTAPAEPVTAARNDAAIASPSDTNPANNADFVLTDVLGVADLSIVKEAEQAGAPGSDCAVYADENILYTLTVSNAGPST